MTPGTIIAYLHDVLTWRFLVDGCPHGFHGTLGTAETCSRTVIVRAARTERAELPTKAEAEAG